MYIATLVLFLIPSSLLCTAWYRSIRQPAPAAAPNWRHYFLIASLIIGTICVVADMTSWFSWSHNGGSPHGLLPRPGIWMHLRTVIKYSFVATLILAILAKGRGRVLVIASTLSMIFVEFGLGALEMD